VPVEAGRQRGLFTRRQAINGGLSATQVAHRINTGVWRHVAGKAYALAAERPQRHRGLNAVPLTWPDAVVYGISALAYWYPDAPIPSDGIIHCAISLHRRPQVGFALHRIVLPEASVAKSEGVRVQRRIPALVAALAALPPDRGQSLLAWMVARRKVVHEEFAAAVAAFAPRRGVHLVRSYLPLVAVGAASVAELLASSIFIRFGIGGWRANALVRTARGEAKSADFLFDAERLIVMIDGWKYHGDQRAFQLDRQDQNELVASGYTVLRFTYADVKDRPEHVATQVRETRTRLAESSAS
jgi:hypothetical protein